METTDVTPTDCECDSNFVLFTVGIIAMVSELLGLKKSQGNGILHVFWLVLRRLVLASVEEGQGATAHAEEPPAVGASTPARDTHPVIAKVAEAE